jgi:hypothetical protein
MEGANMGRSNEDEEVNPLEELHRTMPKTSIEKTSSPDTRSRCTPFGAASPNTKPSFRDHCPNAPPLELKLQYRTTQPPIAQDPHGKQLVDHGVPTNIQDHHPNLKVKLSPLRQRRLTRVNSTNVLDEGLRIGEIGRRMNSKVKLVKQGFYRK